jgi:uncharacterized protein YfaT (DUF1175 family)
LLDASDRAAFRAWFTFLADAQFYRQPPDVVDCAGLVRHAMREALRTHSPEWVRLASLPLNPTFPDVRRPPKPGDDHWPLFRVGADQRAPLTEFADVATIVRWNARLIDRRASAARPGDLLYFNQAEQKSPDHLMVFVGASMFEPEGHDWVVYHTGPLAPADSPAPGVATPPEGEVRKVRLRDLLRHPAPRWRPQPSNPRFVGTYRLSLLW